MKVTAQRAPLLHILRDALDSALDQLASLGDLHERVRSCWPLSQWKKVICYSASGHLRCAPVLLCLDEFGKALEWFSEHRSRNGDLYVLQQLIEQSENRKRKPLALVTLQHLAFDDYAADSAALRQREWAKIQGRFRDFPFSDPAEQLAS